MANIALADLFESKSREFRTDGAGLVRFEEDFITAVNRAINKINRKANITPRISRVNNQEAEVDLDLFHEDVLSDGTTLYLSQLGQRLADGAEKTLAAVEARFFQGIDEIRYDTINRAQEADTTDTSDFAKLGGKG